MCGLPGHPFQELNNYSLSATIGLILVARSAGTKQATNAAIPRTSTVMPSEIRSVAETPNQLGLV
jgi:hypothetical protein